MQHPAGSPNDPTARPGGTQPLITAETASRSRPRLAIVVPCYNEELVIRETCGRLLTLLSDLERTSEISPESFIYFVDDGSEDSTWNLIVELHNADGRVKALKLARNFGHQPALLAGLMGVKDRVDCAVTIDADLQHDESAIHGFLRKYKQGAEIVYGVRRDRATDGCLKRLGSRSFYKLMRAMGANVLADHPDYRLVSVKVLNAFSDYTEVNLFLRGIFTNIGFKSAIEPFDVHERFAGKPQYSFGKMLAFALNGITAFSVAPLRLIAIAGAGIVFLSICLGTFVLINALIGNEVPGWASTVLPVYGLGGFQIMMLGVVAEYIGRIYSEVKGRPRFIKDEELL